jgi:hypothetical protein
VKKLPILILSPFAEFNTNDAKETPCQYFHISMIAVGSSTSKLNSLLNPKPPPEESSYLEQLLRIAGIIHVQKAKKRVSNLSLNPSSLASK